MSMIPYQDASLKFKDGKAYVMGIPPADDTLFKGCLMIPEIHLTETQKQTLVKLPSDDARKKYKCCWYLAHTLRPREQIQMAKLKDQQEKGGYLHLLLNKCIKGERACYELLLPRVDEVVEQDLAENIATCTAKMKEILETVGSYWWG